MREVGCPVVVHMYYRYTGLRAADVTGPCLGFLYGLPEAPIESVELRDCRLAHRAEPDPAQAEPAMMVHLRARDYPTCGLYAADVRGLRLINCELRPRHGQPLLAERTIHETVAVSGPAPLALPGHGERG
jgi:hypothetical protein